MAIGSLILSSDGEIVVSLNTIEKAHQIEVNVKERKLKREIVYTAKVVAK